MRIRTSLLITVLLTFLQVRIGSAQITDNPLPAPIEKRGLMVQIRDVVRLPKTLGRFHPDQDVNPAGWARVSFVRDAPDGRRFANDSRGFLYLLRDDAEPSVYLDFGSLFPLTVYNRLESGFIGFGFHPEFTQNGLFYTVHGERAFTNSGLPDFIPPGYSDADITHHNVITEWHANDPAANMFDGTRRELLRVAHVTRNMSHPFGYVGFNPTAEPGDPDYGLLYTSGSDLGFSNGGTPRIPPRHSALTQSSPLFCESTRAVPQRRTALRDLGITRFRRSTHSQAMTIPIRWARSMPTVFATRTGFRGT